jgi:predicted  nucleic acid-binding Zn-ribbon protein
MAVLPLLSEDEIIGALAFASGRKRIFEEQVAEHTAELKKKAKDLERLNKLFVDRGLRMLELKQEIKKLREKL